MHPQKVHRARFFPIHIGAWYHRCKMRARTNPTTAVVIALLTLGAAAGCGHRPLQEGQATWYGPGFVGKHTASGERFWPCRYTAAHRTLPFQTRVRVTNLDNGRSVVVRINDRGPFGEGRIIDLSRTAAAAIRMVRAGVVPVRIRVLRWPPGYDPPADGSMP